MLERVLPETLAYSAHPEREVADVHGGDGVSATRVPCHVTQADAKRQGRPLSYPAPGAAGESV